MIVTAGTFSSCLKDSATTVDFTNAKGSLELPAAAFSGVLQVEALDIQTTPTPLSLMVNLSGAKPSGSNTTATLAVDQNALTAYNTANSTSYELLPQAAYSISSLSVSIPAGQRSANLTININTSVIDPSKQYALPLTIVDGGGQQINPQYKTVIYAVQVKNKYDGKYTVTGSLVDIVVPTITGAYPRNIELRTQGASSVVYFDTGLGNYAHNIVNGTTPSSYGTFAPVFNFDPSTNKITSVINYYGQPTTGNNRSARLDVTGINAVSGTPGQAGSVIKVKYVLVQGTDRTFFDETFTYTGSR